MPHPENPLYRLASVLINTQVFPKIINFDTIPVSIVGITTSIRWNILGEKPNFPNPKAKIYFPTNYSDSIFDYY